jgi:hypothetical protein
LGRGLRWWIGTVGRGLRWWVGTVGRGLRRWVGTVGRGLRRWVRVGLRAETNALRCARVEPRDAVRHVFVDADDVPSKGRAVPT